MKHFDDNTKKHKKMALKIIAALVVAVLLCVLAYVVIPFYYCGNFKINEYQYSQYIDLEKDLFEAKNIG